jgi:hypothetical protein
MNPTGADLRIDTLLSDVSIGYMNEPSSYVADQVFPIINSKVRSGKYAIYKKHEWFRDEAKKRAPLTESAGGHFEIDTPGTYYCDDYSFHKDYADEDVTDSDDVYNIEDDCASYTVEKIRLNREVRWATAYFGEGIWSNDLSGQTDAPSTNEFRVWDDYTNSTPIEDIDDAKTLIRIGTGVDGNVLVVSERVHKALKNHPDVLDRFKYTQKGLITEDMLAGVFEIDKYIVAKAVKTTTNEGASTQTMAYIVDQYGALLMYVNPRPSKRRPSAGYIFRWNRPRFGGADGQRFTTTTRKFYMPKVQGTRIESSSFEYMDAIAADCGVFFKNAVARGRTITS